MLNKFKLYIKLDNKFISYGCGDMTYIRELLYDYLIKNDMYSKDEVEFKIKRLK